MDFDFASLAEEFVRREPRERRPHSYYASEIPYCLRKVYYAHIAPMEWPVEKLLLFRAGDQAHWFVRSVLKAAGTLVESERSISVVDPDSDVEISGRMDDLLVIRVGEAEEQAVVEVKSVSRFGLGYLDAPRPEHVMQVMPYMRCVPGRHGYIVYVQRDDFQSKTFPVQYDAAVLKAALARAVRVDGCISRGEPPEPEARLLGREWECEGCRWADECALAAIETFKYTGDLYTPCEPSSEAWDNHHRAPP